ncbi:MULTISPECIES: GNAT family N-acetyltransferase [Tenacibaculum]|uniref:GNAT family N-acetyltransferase n=1 Tax=Tenacibaculum TaxID=104267 RepID=UPI001F0B08E7|nr:MULTISPECIES: GNAT family N-acetyltransferase [Tenacibaculum]MCH3881251.1 GNAT family N-acetyltransferase [Tenacibaculum aquimarinum]MDO6599155.1 GNAT family N-acetyltransferase [Tenacibaculum sp. 1_MG-2023]
MTLISTRIATLKDLEVLLTFEQGVIEAERPMDPFLKKGNINYYNIEELITAKNTHLIVAVSKDEVVGSGYIRIENSRIYHKNEKHGYIGFMFVKPSFRGKKISGLILESLKNWAKKESLNEIRLDVYHNNPAAIKSYERFGFNKSLVNMRLEF